MQVAIVDYGCGNLTSVAGAVRTLGFEPTVTSSVETILAADRVILPGVGAFGDCMRQLRSMGLFEALDQVKNTRPILGVCLGAQLMCRESEEYGRNEGFGWIDAEVRLLHSNDASLRVPHVGWDNFEPLRPSILFENIPRNALFYYVHSYAIHCAQPDLAVSSCEYGESFTAAFQVGHVYGVQFHPEKSQKHGLTLLRNFITKAV